MDAIAHLIALVDAYRAATGLSDSRISTLFLGAGHRLKTIRAGGDIGARQVAGIIGALSAAWPEGAVWPDAVPRPATADVEESAV